MSLITDIEITQLSRVTKKLFKEAIYLCYKGGATTEAPLGWSGDTILIHGKNSPDVSRCSQVSIRNYCGNAELLITNRDGSFLFYGTFDARLGLGVLLEQYWSIFKLVRPQIKKSLPKRPDIQEFNPAPNCTKTIGFDLLNQYFR